MRYWMSLAFLLSAFCAYPQKIFSEGEFEYKKPFAPYEIQNVIGVGLNDFIILHEYQKGSFKLSRLDEYFLDRWSKIIEYGNEGSYPKLLKIGDEVVVFRFWINKNKAEAEVRIYDINTGEMTGEYHKTLIESVQDLSGIQVKFSPAHSLFMIYNVPNEEQLYVYMLKNLEKKISYSIKNVISKGKIIAPYLNETGELFLALGDDGTFALDIIFFNKTENSQPIKLTSNFTFARPADEFTAISILKQSESTYFVQTVANIEDELVGINISSFNVILKSVLLSNTINMGGDFIKSAYEKSIFTSENQKKKYITTPSSLTGFDFQEMMIDSEGNITSIFEKQELPSTFHNTDAALNFSLKWKEPEEKYYTSEDLLLLNFSAEGEINWSRVIQKSQMGQGSGLTLSYLSNLTKEDELRLIMKESAKGNSIYYFNIDLANGEVITRDSFMEKKIELNKNYCAWINTKTLLLCGNTPGSNKRNLYLVEF